MHTIIIMSGSSSLSAAKRRRGNVPVNPSQDAKGITPAVTRKMPNPLDILKDHEIRIRNLETHVKDNNDKHVTLESNMSSFKKELLDLKSQLNHTDSIKKKPNVSFTSNTIEPTFSNLKIKPNSSIKEDIPENDSDNSE